MQSLATLSFIIIIYSVGSARPVSYAKLDEIKRGKSHGCFPEAIRGPGSQSFCPVYIVFTTLVKIMYLMSYTVHHSNRIK